MKVCIVAGCPTLTTGTRCALHERQTDRARGTRTARGYGRQHDQLRTQWAPLVATGLVQCRRCRLLITPGDAWHLDHTDDRSGYLGPSHARCNTAAGGRAAHRPTPPLP